MQSYAVATPQSGHETTCDKLKLLLFTLLYPSLIIQSLIVRWVLS